MRYIIFKSFYSTHIMSHIYYYIFIKRRIKVNECLKKVWITGASSGIGKALAIKFANEGWQVAASARRENLLQDLNNN